MDRIVLMKDVHLIVMSLGFAACRYEPLPQLAEGDAHGGDDSGALTDSPRLDAQSSDAPGDGVGHTCYVPADLGTLTLGNQGGGEATSNWFSTSGTDTLLTIGASLPTGSPPDVMIITVVRPAAGFPLNQNIPFATTYSPPPANQTGFMIWGDYDTTVNPATHQQMLFASNGSIRFTAIGQNNGDLITGTVSMTDFREVNEATAAPVVPGCTTKVGGIAFYLKQQM